MDCCHRSLALARYDLRPVNTTPVNGRARTAAGMSDGVAPGFLGERQWEPFGYPIPLT